MDEFKDEITRIPDEYKKWEDIPDGIATKTTLYRDYGLKLAKDQKPVARKKQYNHKGKHVGWYMLYDMNECVPKKKVSEARLQALEKARYMAELLVIQCKECQRHLHNRYHDPIKVTRKEHLEKYQDYVCDFCDDKYRAIEWAKHITTLEGVVVLDTETTDFDGEIIEIAIVDMQGNVVLDQRIKPEGEMNPGAEDIHGISLDDLKDCPTFPMVYEQIKQAITQKIVLIYNASFDTARLQSDCERHELDPIKYGYDCVMLWYAQYVGEWNDYHGNYRWQKLNGGHSALSDCKATLQIIKDMANG